MCRSKALTPLCAPVISEMNYTALGSNVFLWITQETHMAYGSYQILKWTSALDQNVRPT